MTASSDQYREIAVLQYAAAQDVGDSAQRAEFLDLALAYLRLAEMAERTAPTEMSREASRPQASDEDRATVGA